jgi:DNA polymerase phi
VGYLKGVVVKDDDSDRCVSIFQGLMGSADAKSLGERRKWAIEQLSSLVRNAKVPKSDDWVSEVLDFLMVHGLFFVKSAKPSKSLSISVPKPPLSTGSVNVCRERFFAAILDLTTASPPREGEKRREQGRNDNGQLWLRRALDIIAQVEKDAKAFEPVVEVDEEIVKMRKDAMELLVKVSTVRWQTL